MINHNFPPQRRLRVLFSDPFGLARGKYIAYEIPDSDQPQAKNTHKSAIHDGQTRFCQGIYALTLKKSWVDAPGIGSVYGLSDFEARYFDADIHAGWENNTLCVVSDLYDTQGAPFQLCGRGALKRAVAEWRKLGMTPQFGVELEGYIFERDAGGQLRPFDLPGGFCYGTGPALDPNGFLEKLWEAAQKAQFRIAGFHSEFDAPQFEFALKFDQAVTAIDEIFLFKQMAREIAHHCGLVLTFMPKPIAHQSGSGVHFNLSFIDKSGRNLLAAGGGEDIADKTNPDKMTPLMRGVIAGLLHHHQGLAGLLAASVNSYHRLKPASLVGYWRNWGYDHRGVTVRVASDSGEHARIEHRMGDASCNLYTAAAAILQAARLGFIHQYALPAAESKNCITECDATDGVGENLAAALRDLAADEKLISAIGAELVANHIAVKTQEIIDVAALNEISARDYYLNYY
ncbi:MAG: glutamine synthetase [Alphaproteobacteria bacterium]|nr:glutamine synthetase [Alphaproteobacteria bacterium]